MFSLPHSYLIGIRLLYCLAHLIPDRRDMERTNGDLVLYGCNKAEVVPVTSRLILSLHECEARTQ